MKLKAEVVDWECGLYSVHMEIGRRGSLETSNYKTKAYAKRAFRAMCNQLGIDKSKYEFMEK